MVVKYQELFFTMFFTLFPTLLLTLLLKVLKEFILDRYRSDILFVNKVSKNKKAKIIVGSRFKIWFHWILEYVYPETKTPRDFPV